MSKFYGKVGFVKDVDDEYGVSMPVSEERSYYGDIIRLDRRWDQPNEVNDHLNLSEEISIVADSYILENLSYIKYVIVLGVKWKVKTITPAYPRIRLTLGGEYNGDNN
jgi:hypothetical protein